MMCCGPSSANWTSKSSGSVTEVRWNASAHAASGRRICSACTLRRCHCFRKTECPVLPLKVVRSVSRSIMKRDRGNVPNMGGLAFDMLDVTVRADDVQ